MLFSLDHIFFVAEYPEPSVHRHFAKHIIFSAESLLRCTVNEEIFDCKGVIIQSNAAHTVKSKDAKMFVFLVDETCNLAKEIDRLYLHGQSYCMIDEFICDAVIAILTAKGLTLETDIETLNMLGLQNGGAREYDDRIQIVIDEISSDVLYTLDVKSLARHTCLSESRLSHLFREQVGITLSGYLVLVKMARAYQHLSDGADITSAAMNAGFSSSAHFAAVVKKNFGISTREVTKHTNPLSSLR